MGRRKRRSRELSSTSTIITPADEASRDAQASTVQASRATDAAEPTPPAPHLADGLAECLTPVELAFFSAELGAIDECDVAFRSIGDRLHASFCDWLADLRAELEPHPGPPEAAAPVEETP